jgi:hypothetical protein
MLLFYGDELLALCTNPKLNEHPIVGSTTAHSVYFQTPAVSGGRLLHPQPEDTPCRGDKEPACRGRLVLDAAYTDLMKEINEKRGKCKDYERRRTGMIDR